MKFYSGDDNRVEIDLEGLIKKSIVEKSILQVHVPVPKCEGEKFMRAALDEILRLIPPSDDVVTHVLFHVLTQVIEILGIDKASEGAMFHFGADVERKYHVVIIYVRENKTH